MGDILGIRVTHSPFLIPPDEGRLSSMNRTLRGNDRGPPEMKDSRSWPEPMWQSPWRVALIASSSWSHAFLTEKNHWLWPDVESERHRFEELRDADYDAWSKLTTAAIEDAGQQELLNWLCLAGAMAELGYKPDIVDYIESYIFNSNKCIALFKPYAS